MWRRVLPERCFYSQEKQKNALISRAAVEKPSVIQLANNKKQANGVEEDPEGE